MGADNLDSQVALALEIAVPCVCACVLALIAIAYLIKSRRLLRRSSSDILPQFIDQNQAMADRNTLADIAHVSNYSNYQAWDSPYQSTTAPIDNKTVETTTAELPADDRVTTATNPTWAENSLLTGHDGSNVIEVEVTDPCEEVILSAGRLELVSSV